MCLNAQVWLQAFLPLDWVTLEVTFSLVNPESYYHHHLHHHHFQKFPPQELSFLQDFIVIQPLLRHTQFKPSSNFSQYRTQLYLLWEFQEKVSPAFQTLKYFLFMKILRTLFSFKEIPCHHLSVFSLTYIYPHFPHHHYQCQSLDFLLLYLIQNQSQASNVFNLISFIFFIYLFHHQNHQTCHVTPTFWLLTHDICRGFILGMNLNSQNHLSHQYRDVSYFQTLITKKLRIIIYNIKFQIILKFKIIND